MNTARRKYTELIFYHVFNSCRSLSGEKSQPIPVVLGISNEDAQELINKIIIAIPDSIFYLARKKQIVINDMLIFISKNFILFQNQEDLNDKDYAVHLINFITFLVHDIVARYYYEK